MAVRGPAELRRSPRLPAGEKTFLRAITCTGLSLVGWTLQKGRTSLCECRGLLQGHPLTTPACLYRSADHAGEEGSNAGGWRAGPCWSWPCRTARWCVGRRGAWRSAMSRIGTPPSRPAVQNVRRNPCGVMRLQPAVLASRLTMRRASSAFPTCSPAAALSFGRPSKRLPARVRRVPQAPGPASLSPPSARHSIPVYGSAAR